MLAAGALTAVEMMEKDPEMFAMIQDRASAAQEAFGSLPGLELVADEVSVVKHLRLRRPRKSRQQDRMVLEQVVNQVNDSLSFFYNNVPRRKNCLCRPVKKAWLW